MSPSPNEPLLPLALEHKVCSNKQGPSSAHMGHLNIRQRRITHKWDWRRRCSPSKSPRRRDAWMQFEMAPKLVTVDIRGSMLGMDTPMTISFVRTCPIQYMQSRAKTLDRTCDGRHRIVHNIVCPRSPLDCIRELSRVEPLSCLQLQIVTCDKTHTKMLT